jgi:hypothetical protein
MNAVAASSPAFAASAAKPAAETDLEDLLFKLEEDALRIKVALRVQEIGMPSQPLSRIDVTDLALMIVSGTHMGRVFDAAFLGGPDRSPVPAGYAEGW